MGNVRMRWELVEDLRRPDVRLPLERGGGEELEQDRPHGLVLKRWSKRRKEDDEEEQERRDSSLLGSVRRS